MRRGTILEKLRVRATSGMLCGVLLAAHALPLGAHDVWLEPSNYRADGSETVAIDVLVGERFRGERLPRRPQRIADFRAVGIGWSLPVRGAAGVAPAGVLRLPAELRGPIAVHYRSRPAAVRLSRQRFLDHLTSEGLEEIAIDPIPATVREVYSRCVSALLRIGEGRADPPPAPDCPLVVWPRGDSVVPTADEPLELVVRKEGMPVVGIRVSAIHRDDPEHELSARTDDDGLVRLVLSRPGVWLVKAIHLEPDRSGEADWRSWWAALTFEVPPR
ncbi:MAG: DUF4198 domain-containing protein [Thermoanaerobaculia bacterium]|nr:DUF4198 domain-containing protein [Thermoanaerobaculia bacterium]